MKKVVLLSLGLFIISGTLMAQTRHDVTVANFQFTPAVITNVFVGDTIKWIWSNGNHTTTCDPANEPGTSLPAGASTWDAQIRSSSPTFTYVVQVAGAYHYVCSPHAPNMAGDFTAQVVQPIKLTALQLNGAGEKVFVKWGTETEQNTDYFVIRRSVNGSTFEDVATVPAAGNSTTLKSYAYNDKVSSKQKYYYYTIVAVDKDGRKVNSEIALYKNAEAPTKIIASLSPNPVSRPGHLMMTFNSESEGLMDVKVISAEGKVILSTKMQAYAGVNRGHAHLGDLASGTYTLVCTLNGVTETHKLIYR